MRDTVLIDLTEIKASFWDRLQELSAEDETTIKELLIELRNQFQIMNELIKADIEGE